MAELDNFIAHVKRHGLARANRFEVEIQLPQSLMQSGKSETSTLKKAFSVVKSILLRGGETTRGLNIMCHSAQLPGLGLVTSEHKHNKSNEKVAYDVIFDDLSLQFRVSKDMYEKVILDSWLNEIYDHKKHAFSYRDEYLTDIFIHQLDDVGNRVYSIQIIEAFPLTISPIGISHESGDTFHILEAQFAYRKWIKTEDQDENDIENIFDSPEAFLNYVTSPKALSKVYDIVVAGENPGFTGESLGLYNKVNDLVKDYADVSLSEVTGMLQKVKNDISNNNRVSSPDKISLENMIDNITNNLGL